MFDYFQWAHFPAIQYKGDGDNSQDGDYSQSEENVTLDSEVTEVKSLIKVKHLSSFFPHYIWGISNIGKHKLLYVFLLSKLGLILY